MDKSAAEASPGLPGGTVAFLFSDLEGSTELVRTLGDDYARLIEQHHRLLQEVVASNGGRVVDSQADSFFAVFPRVRDAAAAAAQVQRELAASEWPGEVEVRARIGLHAGEPVVTEERYVGLGVHRAARICAIAGGGQVLLSQAAASLLVDNEPPDVSVRSLGEHRLKDFAQPEPLFQLVIDGLRADFPPLSARARPEQAAVDFRILGPLEVLDRTGEPVALGGQKQRGVLALLLLERGRVVPTEVIVDRLWGEEPPRTATTSLQNAISRLRKLLGPDRLVTKPPGYALQVEPDELDLGRFERLVGEARELKPDGRALLLREALDLWRGQALADFAYETFAQNEIARLDELRSSVLEDRVDAELELGHHSELVGELEGLVATYPLRERLRGQHMLALYQCGRQAEALDAYQEARRVLVDELGIEPSPRLQELSRQILRQEGALEPVATATPLTSHYHELLSALAAGRLVPVLGAGGRAKDGQEIASYLADHFECPAAGLTGLAMVSQYVNVTRGSGPLYDELHALFDVDPEPTPVHRLLARLPAFLRDQDAPPPLLVTTGFDTSLEQAFREAGEEIDVVSYIALGSNRGKFLHVQPDGAARVIEMANTYAELRPDDRTVILKVHGQVDRGLAREWESFVVSEDDYIDYLAQTDIANLVPVTVAAKLRRSHFLFLGYPPQEWNFRVFLRRVWGGQRVSYRSWAVEPKPDHLSREFWRHVDVELLDIPLDEYVRRLDERTREVVAT